MKYKTAKYPRSANRSDQNLFKNPLHEREHDDQDLTPRETSDFGGRAAFEQKMGAHNYNSKSAKRRPTQLKHIDEYKPNNNLGMSGMTSKLSGSEIVEAQPSSASIPAANPSVLALGPQGSMVQSYGGNGGSRFMEDSHLP